MANPTGRLRHMWDLDDSVGSAGRAFSAVIAVVLAFVVATVASDSPLGVQVLIGLVVVLVVYPALLASVRAVRRRRG